MTLIGSATASEGRIATQYGRDFVVLERHEDGSR
jgi:hypothetical protein